MSVAALTHPPGWYGKLPALGDFASRRLPPGFISALDEWLQSAVRGSQQALGPTWLDHFLTAPVWRYCLFPGVCGEQDCWVGVLMPSVDRVGRYFPLTVAMGTDVALVEALMRGALDGWFGAVEAAARGTLRMQATVEDFEQALGEAPEDWGATGHREANAVAAELFATRAAEVIRHRHHDVTIDRLLSGAGTAALVREARGRSLWWTDGDRAPGLFHVADGWPTPQAYVHMLGEPALLPAPIAAPEPGTPA